MTEPGQRQDRKQEIQRRMMKSALTLWGMQPSDAPQLDPIVALLMGACATELESVYREIDGYQGRILERLAQLLVPEVNRGPLPAYAVLKADPRLGRQTLTALAQYAYRPTAKPGRPGAEEPDIYFTPVGDTTLVGVKLTHLWAGGTLYAIEDGIQRQPLGKATLPANQAKALWLGFEVDNDCTNLAGLSLYFDWPTYGDTDQVSLYLQACQLSLNGQPVPLASGADLPGLQSEVGQVDRHFDHMASHMNFVRRLLQHRFLTLGEFPITPDLRRTFGNLPDELAGTQADELRKQLPKKLLWLKVAFPVQTPVEVVTDAVCVPNAFAAVNRRYVEFLFRMQSGFQVVPIQPGADYFVSLQRVTAGGEGAYTSSAVTDVARVEEGRYLLRRGGVERFDTRDASEALRHVLDLMQEEALAFQLAGQDSLLPMLRDLNITLNAINAKMTGPDRVRDRLTFLFLKPKAGHDNLRIGYWSCAGAQANGLQAGTKLNAQGSEASLTEKALLVASPTGGRGPLSPDEALESFKSALLTRERIVTEADLRHFLAAELGASLKSMSLKRPYVPSLKVNGGFEKVMRVQVRLAAERAADSAGLKQALETKIQQASSGMVDFDLALEYESA